MDFTFLEKASKALLGDDVSGHFLTWYQMGIRSTIVFFIALLFIRLAGMRVFGEKSAFDVVVSIILGAVLSRAIFGGSPFLPIIFAAGVIVFLHRLLSYLSFRHHKIGLLVKGTRHHLVKNGEIMWSNMAMTQITERDIMEALREKTHLNDISEVEEAFFERNGQISFVLKKPEMELIKLNPKDENTTLS
jgi:uncharacterized membrane protein YcaP (DUF421 family)